jgi:predicted amidohydrolase YtcJ
MIRKLCLLLPVSLALLFGGTVAWPTDRGPDLILFNGRVFTADPHRPHAEAIAISGTRIIAVGISEQVKALATRRTILRDLHGRVVIPGINDAHYHMAVQPPAVTLALTGLEPGWPEVQQQLAQSLSNEPAGTLVFADVGATILDDPAVDRSALDQIAPEHPVILRGWTGHFYILNTQAIRRLGIPEGARDPMGGQYQRASNGQLTGRVLEYAAFDLMRRISDLADDATALLQARAFIDEAVRLGITSVQQMSMPVAPERLASLFDRARTPIRMRIMPFGLTDERGPRPAATFAASQGASPLVSVSGTKWVLDGTPVEHTSAMLEPFSDRPSTSGSLPFGQPALERMLRQSIAERSQFIAHAVGDRAAVSLLDAMDATGGSTTWSHRRLRIEHGDGLEATTISRARRLGVVVVANPSHFTLNELLLARLGPARFSAAEPLRSLLDAGVPLALGSDGPLNPYLNIMFACLHPSRPAEALTREQAVTAYTLGSAYAEFSDHDKGSIEVGKWADLAVLSQDIFSIPAAELPATESLLTLVGGTVVYDALR